MSKPISNKQLQKILKEYVKQQRLHIQRLDISTRNKVEQIFRTHQNQIEAIYRDYITGRVNLNTPFRFSDYPHLERYFEPIQISLQTALYSQTLASASKAWEVANKDIEPIVKFVFPNTPNERLTKYLGHNEAAKNAFLNRNIANGRTLKGRTWLLSKKYLREVEDTLTIGIHNGDSADKIGRRIADYLNNPDNKVRDIEKISDKAHKQLLEERIIKEGNTLASNQRSVKKHAKALAANETNLAYRNAETERINKLDFVVGYEIKLSNAHPRRDICDDMQGRYPKSFVWNGWHPRCLCYRVMILKTPEELEKDNESILQGKEIRSESKNTVRGIPKEAKQYLIENYERFSKYSNKPYFLQDNESLIKGLIP